MPSSILSFCASQNGNQANTKLTTKVHAAVFLLGVEIYDESRGVIKKEYTVMIRDSFSSYGKQKSCLEKIFGDINY